MSASRGDSRANITRHQQQQQHLSERLSAPASPIQQSVSASEHSDGAAGESSSSSSGVAGSTRSRDKLMSFEVGGGGGGGGSVSGSDSSPTASRRESLRAQRRAVAAAGSSATGTHRVSEQQATRPASASGVSPAPSVATAGVPHQISNTQRLSSIEILNENKQRQLQLEQQESFKQHLEQRQRFIQQQHAQLEASGSANRSASCGGGGSGGNSGSGGAAQDFDYNSAYQVETSAPDYVRMAASRSASAAAGGPAAASSSFSDQKNNKSATSVTVNPFDEQLPRPQAAATARAVRADIASASDDEKSASGAISGKSGFLATLMGGSAVAGDESSEELINSGRSSAASGANQHRRRLTSREQSNSNNNGGDDDDDLNLPGASRYSRVAQSSTCSYNYGGGGSDPSRKPFYRRDLTELLQDCRGSRKLVILIVAIALLLDNMLLTSVVPIIPAYLYKLRIEREHREQLTKVSSQQDNVTSSSSSGGPSMYGKLDTNKDGRVDDDELAAELERRINQSLANVQDRFSGSFFSPRVKGSAAFARQRADDDDDDDDGDDVGADRNDDDDDMGRSERIRDEVRSRVLARLQRAAEPAAATKPARVKAKTAKLNEADYDEQEEDDDDDDDERETTSGAGAGGQKNQKMQRATTSSTISGGGGDASNKKQKKGKSSSSIARQNEGSLNSNRKSNQKPPSNNERGDDDDDDDDDEEMADSRRWNLVRKSLTSMARENGNDTDALGGMCLNMVLGRYDGSSGAGSAGEGGVAGNSGNFRSRGDNRNDDDDDDEQQTTTAQDRGKVKTTRRPLDGVKVERLRPAQKPGRGRGSGKDDREGRRFKQQKTEEEAAAATSTAATTIGNDDDEIVINHQDIVDESFEVGVMFASKPIVQALANPFVGAITNRVGFTLPMFLGFTIMFLSTLVFAFGTTYTTLFLARAIQGVGSACTSVAGMSMIADRFPDDAERGNAMAVALGGLALGVVIGPPFGGFMFQFFGKPSPFIVLAGLALMDGLLQLLVLQPRVSKCTEEGASLMTLIRDPYILVAAGAITFANTGIGILEPALPLWMMDKMQAKNWEQGAAFLPAALSYLFSTNLFGNLGLRIGRWRSAMLGLIVIGCALLLVPFASNVYHLILPNGAIGFAIGMVDSTMMPMLGYLVDIRHTSVYGSVYAIGDVAFCASFVFGPALSGTLVKLIGFEGLIITTALICFAFAPLLLMLRDPPARLVNEPLEGGESGGGLNSAEQAALRFVNYGQLDETTLTGKAGGTGTGTSRGTGAGTGAQVRGESQDKGEDAATPAYAAENRYQALLMQDANSKTTASLRRPVKKS